MLSPYQIAIGFLLELKGGGAFDEGSFWEERLEETLRDVEDADNEFPLSSDDFPTPD